MEQLEDTPDPPTLRHRKTGVLAAVAATTYLADLISKIIVVATLSDRPPVPVVDGILQLRLVRNPGAAFGLGVGMTIVFTLVAIAVVVIIVRVARRLGSTWWALALGFLLGGALGNLTDRLFRAPGPGRGHVVDFLELPYWPVFNVADSAIVAAGIVMVALSVKNIPVEGVARRGDT